jgi:hypothetical protein
MARCTLVLLALTLCFSLQAGAASFTADFNSGPDPTLVPFATSSDFEVAYTGGQVVFSLAEDTPLGVIPLIGLKTPFGLTGDYSVTVEVEPISLANTWPNLAWAFLTVGNAYISFTPDSVAATLDPPQSGPSSTFDPTAPFLFEIARSGSTVSISYDAGAGPQLLLSGSDPNVGDPVVLFDLLATGQHGDSVAFDSLQIDAGGFATPEPATWSLGLAAGLVCLALYRRRARQSRQTL